MESSPMSIVQKKKFITTQLTTEECIKWVKYTNITNEENIQCDNIAELINTLSIGHINSLYDFLMSKQVSIYGLHKDIYNVSLVSL